MWIHGGRSGDGSEAVHRAAGVATAGAAARDTARMSLDDPATAPVADPSASGEGPLAFTCPRCRLEVVEAFYGPCTSCRTTLRATLGGDAREVEAAAYEPKMNVTPNAVALKE